MAQTRLARADRSKKMLATGTPVVTSGVGKQCINLAVAYPVASATHGPRPDSCEVDDGAIRRKNVIMRS